MTKDGNASVDALSYEVEQVTFYAKLGSTITQWAELESALSEVLQESLKGADKKAIALAFYGPDHFHSRLQMTSAVAEHIFEGARLEEWSFLQKRISTAARLRNKLVHSQCIILTNAKPGRRFKLREAVSDPSSLDIGEYNTGIHLDDLEEIGRRFSSVSAAITCFVQRLGGRPETLRGLVLDSDYHNASYQTQSSPPR